MGVTDTPSSVFRPLGTPNYFCEAFHKLLTVAQLRLYVALHRLPLQGVSLLPFR